MDFEFDENSGRIRTQTSTKKARASGSSSAGDEEDQHGSDEDGGGDEVVTKKSETPLPRDSPPSDESRSPSPISPAELFKKFMGPKILSTAS